MSGEILAGGGDPGIEQSSDDPDHAMTPSGYTVRMFVSDALAANPEMLEAIKAMSMQDDADNLRVALGRLITADIALSVVLQIAAERPQVH